VGTWKLALGLSQEEAGARQSRTAHPGPQPLSMPHGTPGTGNRQVLWASLWSGAFVVDFATMERDDSIRPVVRAVSLVIVFVLVLAVIVLYFMPAQTERFWAWTISPVMTPMLMGAGYARALTSSRAWRWPGRGARLPWGSSRSPF
jgi:hypothetical protein